MKSRGSYVVVEGGDGSGKDTQADLLCGWFRSKGLDPLRLNEPDDTLPTGKLMRQMLKDGSYVKAHAVMFLADRMAMLPERVTPARDSGRPVVCCRSFLSTLVYQQENWPLDWLFAIHKQLPEKPTHLVILDVPPEVGMARVGKRVGHTEYYEKVGVQKRVRERYRELASKDPRLEDMMEPRHVIATLDGSRPIADVQRDIRMMWSSL